MARRAEDKVYSARSMTIRAAYGSVVKSFKADDREWRFAEKDRGSTMSIVEVASPTMFYPKIKYTEPELKKETQTVNGYYIDPDARVVFNSALRMSKAVPDKAVKMMMMGPSGYGKTTLPRIFAEAAGMDFMRMNCATVRDSEEWFGYREARDGTTVFVRSAFAKALEKGGIVMVLDEFNRLEPWLHNTLMPLLDHDGKTVVHDEEFKIGPNVILVGTINLGYRFTGTFELDEAVMNRFEFTLEVGAMPFVEEKGVLQQRTGVKEDIAHKICTIAQTLREREVPCSTRSTLLIAQMVVTGLGLREAFEFGVIRRLPTDTHGNNLRKTVIDQVNVAIGPYKSAKVTNDVFGGGVIEEKEVIKEESGDEIPYYTVTLSCPNPKKNKVILMVQLIKAFRGLAPDLTLVEAKKTVELLVTGHEVDLKTIELPGAETISLFESHGIEYTWSSL